MLEQLKNQIIIMTSMRGALSVARMSDDESRKLMILNTVRDHLLETFDK